MGANALRLKETVMTLILNAAGQSLISRRSEVALSRFQHSICCRPGQLHPGFSTIGTKARPYRDIVRAVGWV